jgi:hypothetical protein
MRYHERRFFRVIEEKPLQRIEDLAQLAQTV